ncbi:MAG: hypothetical protein ED557_12825 [Balneola sp.]|nr:MAG: hypothetical protein ED557_12825 [Balneola sp.]
MQDKVFIPKYSFKIKASIIGAFLFFVITLALGIIDEGAHSEIWFWVSLIFWSLLLVFAPLMMFKRIIFGDQIILERYFIKPWIIPYKDVVDISYPYIKLKRFYIPITEIINSEELIELMYKEFERRELLDHLSDVVWKENENSLFSSLLSLSFSLSILTLLENIFSIQLSSISWILIEVVLFSLFFAALYNFKKRFYKNIEEQNEDNYYRRLDKLISFEMSLTVAFFTSIITLYIPAELEIFLSIYSSKVNVFLIWLTASLLVFSISFGYFQLVKKEKF